jgi:hypothetical protein
VLARPLESGTMLDGVLGATAHAFACLEIVDAVSVGYRLRLENDTACALAQRVLNVSEYPFRGPTKLEGRFERIRCSTVSLTGSAHWRRGVMRSARCARHRPRRVLPIVPPGLDRRDYPRREDDDERIRGEATRTVLRRDL